MFTPSQIDAANEYAMRYYRKEFGLLEPTPAEVLMDNAECRAMVFGSRDPEPHNG